MNQIKHSNIIKQPLFGSSYILIILTIILTLLNLNCSKQKSTDVMSEEKFVNILSRLMIIEQLKIGQNEKVQMVKQVFEEYNTNSKAFNAYKEKYENDTKHWITIYRKAEKRIKEISSPDKMLKPENISKRDTNAVRN